MLLKFQIFIDGRKGDEEEIEYIERELYTKDYYAAEKVAKNLIRRLLEIKKLEYVQLLWNETLTIEAEDLNCMAYFILVKKGSCLKEKEIIEHYHPENMQELFDEIESSEWEEQGALFIEKISDVDNDKEYGQEMIKKLYNKFHGVGGFSL